MSAEPVILEMRSITKEFPGVTALANVSLTVREGEIHAICGENGAGKSTLVRVLSGVYPYGTYTGDINYLGQTCHFKDIGSSEAAGIVIIHQELALIPELSLTENIFLGNEITSPGAIDGKAAKGRPPGTPPRDGHHGAPDPTPTPTGARRGGNVLRPR